MSFGPSGPSCAVVIRAHRRDFEWLSYCLRALERFGSGFMETVVVVPRSSEPYLRRFGLRAFATRYEICADYRDDYLGQQVTKLYADELTGADFICHLDADMIVSDPLRPSELIKCGRPGVVIQAVAGRDPWSPSASRFLGWEVAHRFMVRPPFTFPRWLYPELRDHCRRVHSMELADYVTRQPPRGFSEFTVLGSYALRHHSERFDWIRCGPGYPPEQLCRWYWSWEGITPDIRVELDALLGTPKKPA